MSFLGPFSAPFRAALAWWPVLALALTLPIVVIRALLRRRICWSYLATSYAAVLYALGLGFFTLYPMPADPAAYCATHSVHAQLVPFHWVSDVLRPHPTQFVLQLVANVLFFVPFGALWWMLGHGRLWRAAVAGLATSLLVESAQLTGAFGLYPCSYRLFDVDDLMVNTLGAVLGFVAARFAGASVGGSHFSSPKVPPTWYNRLLAWTIDLLLLCVCAGGTTLALYPVAGPLRIHLSLLVLLVWGALLVLLERRYRASLGEMLVGLKRPRAPHSNR